MPFFDKITHGKQDIKLIQCVYRYFNQQQRATLDLA